VANGQYGKHSDTLTNPCSVSSLNGLFSGDQSRLGQVPVVRSVKGKNVWGLPCKILYTLDVLPVTQPRS